MINFEGFEKYLDARKNKKYFIPPPDGSFVLTTEIQGQFFKLIKEYGFEEFKKCFEPGIAGTFYGIELFCCECDVLFTAFIPKTRVLDYLRDSANEKFAKEKSHNHSCDVCKSLEKETRLENDRIKREQYQKQWEDNTKDYIDWYLSPTATWKNGTKTYEKFNEINKYSILESVICQHIREMDYSDFLKTPYWKAIADKKKSQAGWRCQTCNRQGNLHVHHRTYSIRGRELQNMKDLIVLCNNCHQTFHDVSDVS
jgi:hypothetical protein